MLHGRFGDICRFMLLSHGKYFYTLLLPVNLKLLDRRRTVNVTGNQKRFLAFELEFPCKLCGSGRLTGSL